MKQLIGPIFSQKIGLSKNIQDNVYLRTNILFIEQHWDYQLNEFYNFIYSKQILYSFKLAFLLKLIKIFHCALPTFKVVGYVKYFSLFYTTRPCAINENLGGNIRTILYTITKRNEIPYIRLSSKNKLHALYSKHVVSFLNKK